MADAVQCYFKIHTWHRGGVGGQPLPQQLSVAAANRRRCDLGDGHCADREPQPLPVDDV